MNWLTKLFKKKETPPAYTLPDAVMKQLTLVQDFTTVDEPKVTDYPRALYGAYWEIFIGQIQEGYVAEVRFYGYNGVGIIFAQHFIGPTLAALKQPVNELIRQRMAIYKRKTAPQGE